MTSSFRVFYCCFSDFWQYVPRQTVKIGNLNTFVFFVPLLKRLRFSVVIVMHFFESYF